MSLTLEKEPASPLFTKNEIAYQVSTDLGDPDARIIAHVFIETTPYSNTWEFVKKIKGYPDPDDSDKAWFYLHDALDAIMKYTDPSDSSGVVDTTVCRRIKIEFYEFLPPDLELEVELYSETYQMVEIEDLEDDNDYLVVLDTTQVTDVSAFQIGSGVDTAPDPDEVNVPLTLNDAWTVGSDFGYQYEKTFNIPDAYGSAVDDVALPAKIKVSIYKWNKPATTVTDIRYVLKGGLDHILFGEMTKDADYWADENLDNVIDEDGNLILV